MNSATVSATAQDAKKLSDALLSVIQVPDVGPTALPAPTELSTEKVPTIGPKDKVTIKDDTNILPEKPIVQEIANKTLITTGMARYPLIPIITSEISTFTPTCFNYFEAIHYMDSMVSSNVYFPRAGLPWHPLISRLYFSVLVYYQTLRSMEYARIGNAATRITTSQLMKDLPPERLPVPGPLLPMLKALCCTKPEDTHYRLVCPKIADHPGPRERPDILAPDSQMLGMPNIPLLLGIINSLIHAPQDAIPNYLNPNAFNDEQDHEFSGYLFPAGNWGQTERSLVCQPGMHRTPETTREIDAAFNLTGATLMLPILDENDELHSILDFLQLSSIEWIDNLIPTMARYCLFFSDSGNLGQCTPFGPNSCLIRSRPTGLTSATSRTNIVLNTTHAFPDMYPYSLVYDHRSYEHHIPQPYATMGQYASFNARCDFRGLQDWSRINLDGHGRLGPYWDQNPSAIQCAKETGMAEIEQMISNHYYIRTPVLN